MPPQSTVWTLDPHTKAKHDLLRSYLGAWYPILTIGGFNPRVLFLDGFAGPGIYDNGEPGSPIIAVDVLVNHTVFEKLKKTEFVFLFVEGDKERVASLESEMAAYFDRMPGGKPKNITVHIIHDSFDNVATTLIETMESKESRLAPTLAFVDPFGFKGAPLETVCRLTASPKCEVFFNFMYDWANRFVAHPDGKIQSHLEGLFGTDEYQNALGQPPAERKRILHDLYRRQLTENGNFEFVLDFEMVDLRGKSYSLFFGTRHIRGLEAMKRAMWSVDPSGQYKFADRHAGTTSLFDAGPDIEPLKSAITSYFEGRTVSIEAVHRFVLTETVYGPGHYKKSVLAPLEKSGGIKVVSSRRKKPTGYPAGTTIEFG